MPRVRGSKQERLVIKPHTPLRHRKSFFVLILFLMLGVSVAFVGGVYYARKQQLFTPAERLEFDELTRAISVLENNKAMDQMALEGARQSIEALQAQLRQQEKTIAFYKSVMAPETQAEGLQIQTLNVGRLAGQNKYRLEWVLAQAGKNDRYLEGDVELNLIGASGSEQRVLSLDDVSETGAQDFKFRYFRVFSSEVDLPQDFTAERIEVIARTKGKDAQSVTREFDWIIQESLADVVAQ